MSDQYYSLLGKYNNVKLPLALRWQEWIIHYILSNIEMVQFLENHEILDHNELIDIIKKKSNARRFEGILPHGLRREMKKSSWRWWEFKQFVHCWYMELLSKNRLVNVNLDENNNVYITARQTINVDKVNSLPLSGYVFSESVPEDIAKSYRSSIKLNGIYAPIGGPISLCASNQQSEFTIRILPAVQLQKHPVYPHAMPIEIVWNHDEIIDYEETTINSTFEEDESFNLKIRSKRVKLSHTFKIGDKISL